MEAAAAAGISLRTTFKWLRRHRLGWEYAHVAVDDHSRAAYVEILPDQTAPRRRSSWRHRRSNSASGNALASTMHPALLGCR